VWSRAAKELGNAENILVIGYSYPRSDAFFHFLYALGTVGSDPLKRFWVYNPDETGEVEKRFRDLLGPAAGGRFRYLSFRFNRAIGLISNELKIKL